MVFLPGIGPLIYLFMMIVPDLFRSRTAQHLQRGAARAIDPNKDYRAAMRDVGDGWVCRCQARLCRTTHPARPICRRYRDVSERAARPVRNRYRVVAGIGAARSSERRWRRLRRPRSTRSRPPIRNSSPKTRTCCMRAPWSCRTGMTKRRGIQTPCSLFRGRGSPHPLWPVVSAHGPQRRSARVVHTSGQESRWRGQPLSQLAEGMGRYRACGAEKVSAILRGKTASC